MIRNTYVLLTHLAPLPVYVYDAIGGGATHSFGDDSLHGAGEGGRHAKAPVIQDVHGHLEASAQLSQQTVCWHANIVEKHLGCVGRLDSHFLLWRTAAVMKTEAWRRIKKLKRYIVVQNERKKKIIKK